MHRKSPIEPSSQVELPSGSTSPGKRSLTGAMGPSIASIARRVADELLRRTDRDGGVADDADRLVQRAASSTGAPLPGGVRSQFESSLGADLSGVRVHTGADSAAAAESVGALAYASGNDVHFGAGQYQPGDPFGLHLLAHEVAHTVQQSGGAATTQHKLEVSSPGDALEHEADRAADAMVRGAPIAVSSGGVSVARATPEAAPAAPGATPAAPDAAPAAAVVTPDQVVVTVNDTGVPASAIQVVKVITAAIGEKAATISSGTRTAAEQAAAMYTNLELTSVDVQKGLYGASGDKVIDVYATAKAEKKDAAAIKQLMTDKVTELGPSKVSNHCSDTMTVVDVSVSSITDDDAFQTQAEANASVEKYLGPKTTPQDKYAHHLELK